MFQLGAETMTEFNNGTGKQE